MLNKSVYNAQSAPALCVIEEDVDHGTRYISQFVAVCPHSHLEKQSETAIRNYRFMGRCKNYNTSTPETRHKETKRKAHKTNNQFSVGMSILQSSMDMEAERHLSFLQDKRGQSSVLTEVKKECSHICKMCTFVSFCSQKECSWNICALKVSK